MRKRKNTVLIVDDVPENLKLLGEIIEADGHTVRVAANGEKALEIVRNSTVDLILLDVMMPVMDGYEVCKHLKSNEKLRNIPVIFLTALDSTNDESKGFELGAADYITKPFKVEIVRLRVTNHLSIQNMKNDLIRHNEKLEELVAERTEELNLAHQKLVNQDAATYDFLQIIYKELWDPNTGVVEITRKIVNRMNQSSNEDLAEQFERSHEKLFAIINNALLFAGANKGVLGLRLQPVRFEAVFSRVVEHLKPSIESKSISILNSIEKPVLVSAELDLLEQVVTTIMSVVLKTATFGSKISIDSAEQNPKIEIRITVSTIEKRLLHDERSLFDDLGYLNKSFVSHDLNLNISLAERIATSFGGGVRFTRLAKTRFQAQLTLNLFEKPRGVKIAIEK